MLTASIQTQADLVPHAETSFRILGNNVWELDAKQFTQQGVAKLDQETTALHSCF